MGIEAGDDAYKYRQQGAAGEKPTKKIFSVVEEQGDAKHQRNEGEAKRAAPTKSKHGAVVAVHRYVVEKEVAAGDEQNAAK